MPKAEPIMLASANLNFEAVGWRQVIMTDQTVLVSRDVENRLPILNFEKRPLGHLLLHPFRAMALPLSGKVRFRTGAKRTVHKLP